MFYEGPPTANGRPGVHHVLARAFKDLFPRYKTMRGFHVARKAGWDTHGLPVEIEVEKELGITDKQQIEEYGIAEFNGQCRRVGVRLRRRSGRRLTERIGFWVDLRRRLRHLHNDYIESVWWILRAVLGQGPALPGLQGRALLPALRHAAVGSHEVAQGYEDGRPIPSVFVRFARCDGSSRAAYVSLVWTTTPWTLPGNVALAVGARTSTYVLVEARQRRANADPGRRRCVESVLGKPRT